MLLAFTVLLGACSDDGTDDQATEAGDTERVESEINDAQASDETVANQQVDDRQIDETQLDEDEAEIFPAPEGGSRDDIDCQAVSEDDEDIYVFTSIHYVVDGVLGDLCHGDDDERLLAAWNVLATITPEAQLADLGVFAAFESAEEGDDVTLAFVNTLDDDGTQFQMSINLDSYEADLDEAQLTMAHEFSHVFAATTTQIDRTIEAIDNCTTYSPGDGCYYDDSLMYAWIQAFWGDGLIDEIDPEAEVTTDSGQDRCDADAGYFGPYAAGTPEEDFAEAFSAYVFDLEPISDGQQARLDWMAEQPGLVEFRERSEAAGLNPLDNNFDECGLG